MINSARKLSLCRCQEHTFFKKNAICWAWNSRWEYVAFPHVPWKKMPSLFRLKLFFKKERLPEQTGKPRTVTSTSCRNPIYLHVHAQLDNMRDLPINHYVEDALLADCSTSEMQQKALASHNNLDQSEKCVLHFVATLSTIEFIENQIPNLFSYSFPSPGCHCGTIGRNHSLLSTSASTLVIWTGPQYGIRHI